MGLDVYLSRFEDQADTERRETKYNEETSRLWKELCGEAKYEEIPKDKLDEYRRRSKEIAAQLELNDYGGDDLKKQKVELPSKKYPEHYFKIGYFRSSYNEGGINRVLSQRIGRDLGDIVVDLEDPENGHEGDFLVDWTATRERAQAAHDELKAKIEAEGALRVLTLSDVLKGTAESAEDAMQLYREQAATVKDRPADFVKEPLTVRAVIHGKPGSSLLSRMLPGIGPETYLVCDDPKGLAWYLQALEIVVETCDYVLALPESEQAKHRLYWSS